MESKNIISLILLVLNSFDSLNSISCLESEKLRTDPMEEWIISNNFSTKMIQELEEYYRNEPKPQMHYLLNDLDECYENSGPINLPLILFALLYCFHLIVFYSYLTQNFSK